MTQCRRRRAACIGSLQLLANVQRYIRLPACLLRPTTARLRPPPPPPAGNHGIWSLPSGDCPIATPLPMGTPRFCPPRLVSGRGWGRMRGSTAGLAAAPGGRTLPATCHLPRPANSCAGCRSRCLAHTSSVRRPTGAAPLLPFCCFCVCRRWVDVHLQPFQCRRGESAAAAWAGTSPGQQALWELACTAAALSSCDAPPGIVILCTATACAANPPAELVCLPGGPALLQWADHQAHLQFLSWPWQAAPQEKTPSHMGWMADRACAMHMHVFLDLQ